MVEYCCALLGMATPKLTVTDQLLAGSYTSLNEVTFVLRNVGGLM